jgi:GMP reductase
MQIKETQLDYSDVLIVPQISSVNSRSDVNLLRTIGRIPWTGVPIVAANMATIGTLEMAEALSKHHWLTCLHKHYSAEDILSLSYHGQYFSAPTIGLDATSRETFRQVMQQPNKFKFVCIDVANGYIEKFRELVHIIRQEHGQKVNIIAGNVVTQEGVEELCYAGADFVKVGIGPGSACTTRKMTGVGYPQFSAVLKCAEEAKNHPGCWGIVADGGCVHPGDVAKAFAAGAQMVMLGGMLAGHDECSGWEYDYTQGKSVPTFYGMASDHAMTQHYNHKADYRCSEGKKIVIEERGKIDNTAKEIMGGIRSACTYVGASNLDQLHKNASFVRVNNQYNKIFGE